MNEREIYIGALEKPSAAERAAFLDDACRGDEASRKRLEALFREQAELGSFLEFPPEALVPGDGATVVHAPPEGPGAVIGPYKLLEQIGEGGMGVVYMAEQAHPVRRRVALKVIKPGMDTRQVVARFEAERQALALMDHPNIARVLDAGATGSGRPYFVMELVRGIPITDYCDQVRLSIPERLELFVLVCRAVQHAHQKGIIHRDLKPTNVLVTLIDGAAVPKVIDFGVAKATGGQLTDKTLFTGLAQMVGTPLYMSPEQAELSGVDVDTRSDIYALGVLLYELLTGTTPFERETFRAAAHDEMRRMIREVEPPTPSTRLGGLGATLAAVSANRQADARTLGHAVRGELDWIVMKALEKDRRRRYETASDFAADVMRHLTDRPVEACPPSARYRFSKYARRNRAALTTAAFVGLALVAGTAMSTWQAARATRAGTLAGRREREARDSAAESKAVLLFFIRDVLGASRPDQALGRDPKVSEALANAETKLDAAFADQPLVEAGVRLSLAVTYHALGRDDLARRHAARSLDLRLPRLGPEHRDTLQAMHTVATLLLGQHKLAEARTLFEKMMEVQRRTLGPDDPDTLNTMSNLAITLGEQGQLAEARTLFERVLEARRRTLGPEAPLTLTAMGNVAVTFGVEGKLDEARKLHEPLLEIRRRVLGPEHPETLNSMEALATTLGQQGKYAEATGLHERTLEVERRILGPEHPETLETLFDLAIGLRHQGKHAEARTLFESTLEIRRRALGPEHPETLTAMYEVAIERYRQGELDEARKLAEPALELRRRILGPEHPETLKSRNLFLNLLIVSPDASAADRARAMELARSVVASKPDDELSLQTLGWAQYRAGDWKGSIETLMRSMGGDPKGGDAFQWYFLAMAHWQLGEKDQARTLFDRANKWLPRYEQLSTEREKRGGAGSTLESLQRAMLRRFRAEAAALLGVDPPGAESEGCS